MCNRMCRKVILGKNTMKMVGLKSSGLSYFHQLTIELNDHTILLISWALLIIQPKAGTCLVTTAVSKVALV